MANAAVATFSGRSIWTSRLKGLGTEPKNIGWGTSAVTASAKSDVALFGPATEARTVGTSSLVTSSQLADVYQVVGAITCAVGAKTITEVGLHDSPTLSTTTSLSASMSSGATSATFAANPAPTTGNSLVQVNNEVILVTGANSTTLSCTRAQLGSSAVAQANGSICTIGGDGGAQANGGVGPQTSTIAASLGGSMFIHADFAGVALNVNDSISFTITDTLT